MTSRGYTPTFSFPIDEIFDEIVQKPKRHFAIDNEKTKCSRHSTKKRPRKYIHKSR